MKWIKVILALLLWPVAIPVFFLFVCWTVIVVIFTVCPALILDILGQDDACELLLDFSDILAPWLSDL